MMHGNSKNVDEILKLRKENEGLIFALKTLKGEV